MQSNVLARLEGYGLNLPFEQVRDFHIEFGHPVATTPTPMSRERREIRGKWKHEEADEFIEAETLTDQVDACLDGIYFNLGTLVELGVLPQPVMELVHGANMNKRHLIDGVLQVVKDSDGKVIKPQGWVAPEPLIEAEIERQSNLAAEAIAA